MGINMSPFWKDIIFVTKHVAKNKIMQTNLHCNLKSREGLDYEHAVLALASLAK